VSWFGSLHGGGVATAGAMSYGSFPAGDRYSTEGERQPAYNFDVTKNMSDSDAGKGGSAVGRFQPVTSPPSVRVLRHVDDKMRMEKYPQFCLCGACNPLPKAFVRVDHDLLFSTAAGQLVWESDEKVVATPERVLARRSRPTSSC